MKRTINRVLATMIALPLTLSGILPLPGSLPMTFAESAPDTAIAAEGAAVADQSADDPAEDDVSPVGDDVVSSVDTGSEAAEEQDLMLGAPAPAEPVPEDAPQADAVVAYCFIADDALLATQEAREGDEIVRPDDPAAPAGLRFAGWFLEDDTSVFVDADGDGAVDPVIAHPDPLCPKVNVIARFVEPEENDPQGPSPVENEEQPQAETDEVSPDAEPTDDPADAADAPQDGVALAMMATANGSIPALPTNGESGNDPGSGGEPGGGDPFAFDASITLRASSSGSSEYIDVLPTAGSYTLPCQPFTRENQYILGWTTDTDANENSVIEYYDGATFTPTTPVTVDLPPANLQKIALK